MMARFNRFQALVYDITFPRGEVDIQRENALENFQVFSEL